MAWEWVGSVTTAVVGLAALGGNSLAARNARVSESSRILQRDKRETYARLFHAVKENVNLYRVAVYAYARSGDGVDPRGLTEYRDFRASHMEVAVVIAEAIMISNAEVRAFLKSLDETLDGLVYEFPGSGNAADWFAENMYRMVDLMREDLAAG